MKVALYTRVSTDQQDAANQVLELHAWVDRQGHTIVAEYQDIMSGAKRREHLDDLFDAARHRKFELVAIWSLDRLTREGPLQTLLYLQRLTAMGVRVYSHQEPYLDPSLPFYESIVAFLADVARWERTRLSERTKTGLSRARSQGKRLGRPTVASFRYCRRCQHPFPPSHFEKRGHYPAERVLDRLESLLAQELNQSDLAEAMKLSRRSVQRLIEHCADKDIVQKG